jgi:hypothetical protein
VLEDFISLKFLPEGNVQELKDSIEPFYYSEVMGTPEFRNLYGKQIEKDSHGNLTVAD